MKTHFIGISFYGIVSIMFTLSWGYITVLAIETEQSFFFRFFTLTLLVLLIFNLVYGFSFPSITDTHLIIHWPLIPFIKKRLCIQDIELIRFLTKRTYRGHYTLLIKLNNGKEFKTNDLILMPYRKIGAFIESLEEHGVKVDNRYYVKI